MENVQRKEGKFVLEMQRELLLFYAVIFLTCVVGMIELLPLINWGTNPFVQERSPIEVAQSYFLLALHFLLLMGEAFSIERCFGIYGEILRIIYSGDLGDYLRRYADEHPGPIRIIIGEGENGQRLSCWKITIIIVLDVFFFFFLYITRISVPPTQL